MHAAAGLYKTILLKRHFYNGRLYFQFVCQFTLRGIPSPSQNTSTDAMTFPFGTPSPLHDTSTGPMSFPGGTLVPDGGTPVSHWVTP